MDEIGVVIGRFQPFHLGHGWLIKKAIEKYSKIIILIGSPSVIDSQNPWTYDERLTMLRLFLNKENLENKVLKIDFIEDVPNDDDWLKLAIKKIGTGRFVVFGDNDWVNKIFENGHCHVFKPGYFEREKYEGTKIRNLYKKRGDWEDLVPKYLIKLISK